MPTVKSINDIKIKEKLRESECPICKQGLNLIIAHEQAHDIHNHFRKQAIKSAEEKTARIRELGSVVFEVLHDECHILNPESKTKLEQVLSKKEES